MTGLPNRRLFCDRLSMAIAHTHRNHTCLAVLLIDLDRFKTSNDTLGHSIGDEILEQVSRRLHACLREDDTVTRAGGAEFLALVSDLPRFADAATTARRIIESLTKLATAGGQEMVMTCSISVAFYPEDGVKPDTLIKNADIAMCRAKERGRNISWLFTDTMDALAQRQLQLEAGLRRALVNPDQIQGHFQPLVDAAEQRGRTGPMDPSPVGHDRTRRIHPPS